MAEETIDSKIWLWRPPEGGYIGRRGLRPKEAQQKVTGRAIYTNDVYLPGMLYAKVFRSPYAHARIKKMDTSKAEALPGVWKVVRYDDPEAELTDPFKPVQGAIWFWWQDSILPDTADYGGVRMGAMVIAESEEVCDQALKLIGKGIEWEQLPFILDPEEAIKPDAPLLHPELNNKTNIWKDVVLLNWGDVEKGFASSDHVIEFNEYKKEDDVWAGVEPGCMVAQFKGDELEFWYHGQNTSTDVLFMTMPTFKNDPTVPKKLKVHTPYNGGIFGANMMGYCGHLVRYALIAARKTQRPIKVVDDYGMSWEGLSYETGVAYYKVGFNNDGNIVAIKIETLQKTGNTLDEKFRDSLKTPNIFLREVRTWWNRPHETCWKDGAANCTLVNLIINKVAAYLGMDPIKIALLNDGTDEHDMAWLNENVKKHHGMPMRDSLKEVVEAGKAAFDWDNKWHAPGTRRLPNGKMHGVGFYAVTSWSTGCKNYGGVPGIGMNKDGTATIFYRRADTGQSAPTTYCQIVADEIGLRYEDVKIEFRDYFYFDAIPPGNSMGSNVNTYGLIVNSRKMRKMILERALQPLPELRSFRNIFIPTNPSPFQGKTVEELDLKESIVFEKANPANSLPVSRIISKGGFARGPMVECGTFFVGDPPPDIEEVKEKFVMLRQCCFIEVEVDTETGQVDVTKLVHPYDVGQSINPNVNEAQLYGGAYQGLGVSGTEALYYDPRTGRRLNENLIGYPILTTLDVGPIETPIIETHLGWNSYGICGCSEAGKAATAAALLVPAVYNAIGKWIEETPVTPEKVLKALGKA
jgi:CO/xanthine dehydrogenase Mo-binding subunit